MGATHSRKKKSSSRNIRRKEDCELREEEQSEGRRRFSFFRESRFHERCVKVEDNADNGAGVGDYKYNIVSTEVNNHNFLEYKLQSIQKKYESNNYNTTEKITDKHYPEQFNPFAIEEEYSSILNPFEDDDVEDDNPLENTENTTTEKITDKDYPEQFNPFAIEEEYSSILNPFEDDDDEDDNSLEKDNLQKSTIVSSLEKVNSIQALEAVDNFISPNLASKIEDKETPENIRNNLNPEYPMITIDVTKSDPKINAIEIDYNEKRNPLCEFENPVNEKANIKKNLTPKNDLPSKNINSCNVHPATKKKSFKKYKAPAPPVCPTLPLKLESHKENENASRIQNLKQSSNYKKNLITPTSLQQEESENRYRISRPAPPVPELMKPVRAIADTALKSMKIVPTNECGRKVRRKSILDLFKVKKKKKEMMDMV